jgi:putative ABC transport system permease protein
VVQDFHFESLHSEIEPFAFFIDEDPLSRSLVRVRTEDMARTLAGVEDLWSRFVPGVPLKYSFLDDRVASLYESEQQINKLLWVFSFLAILIACLGLFGLSAFIIEKRTKEIAVRKALGASTPGIIGMLSKEFAKLGLVAFVIAVPFAYLGVQNWLDSFAYRVDIGAWVFALAGFIVLGIAMSTASFQAAKAARTNPVDSLRCD